MTDGSRKGSHSIHGGLAPDAVSPVIPGAPARETAFPRTGGMCGLTMMLSGFPLPRSSRPISESLFPVIYPSMRLSSLHLSSLREVPSPGGGGRALGLPGDPGVPAAAGPRCPEASSASPGRGEYEARRDWHGIVPGTERKRASGPISRQWPFTDDPRTRFPPTLPVALQLHSLGCVVRRRSGPPRRIRSSIAFGICD